jgi:hypothetical protein
MKDLMKEFERPHSSLSSSKRQSARMSARTSYGHSKSVLKRETLSPKRPMSNFTKSAVLSSLETKVRSPHKDSHVKVLGQPMTRIEEVPELDQHEFDRRVDENLSLIGSMVREKKAREECNISLRCLTADLLKEAEEAHN